MIITDLYTSDIPEIYQRFAKEIGENHWRDRVALCKQDMRGNPFLREFLLRENAIAFQLEALREIIQKHGRVPLHLIEGQLIYEGAGFAAQIVSLLSQSSSEDAKRFRRRVHGALKNPDDMRGLSLELAAATHFATRGKKIGWPETMGIGTFDLLVESPSGADLEVECKSISDDKGRKVHQREVLDFYGLLSPHLNPTLSGLAQGVSAILTLPARLPTGYKDRIELAKKFASAIAAGNSCTFCDGSDVRLTDFDVGQLGEHTAHRYPRELRDILDEVSGTTNRHTMLIGTPQGGALALTVQSAKDDNVIKMIFDTLADAAKRQLTGTRAGMLFISLHGLDADALLSVAEQDDDPAQPPTSLRVAVSRFLSSPERSHIVEVAFASRSRLDPLADGSVGLGGTAYHFPNRGSRFWSVDFEGMFTPTMR